jgi:hypothetical protein
VLARLPELLDHGLRILFRGFGLLADELFDLVVRDLDLKLVGDRLEDELA